MECVGLQRLELLLQDGWGQNARDRVSMSVIHDRLCETLKVITTQAGEL